MICDKCKQKCTDRWIPGVNYPRYKIEETTGIGEIAPINLCYDCSQRLKNWLDEAPESSGKMEHGERRKGNRTEAESQGDVGTDEVVKAWQERGDNWI